MTVLWFILGIILIFAIARYNESNKLFWVLTLAYTLGFAITKMVYDNHNGEEQSNMNHAQVCSTQMPTNSVALYTLFTTECMLEPVEVTAPNTVSKIHTPARRETNVTLSKVFGKVRDQPTKIYFNTS